jgi:hypothetical protein
MMIMMESFEQTLFVLNMKIDAVKVQLPTRLRGVNQRLIASSIFNKLRNLNVQPPPVTWHG